MILMTAGLAKKVREYAHPAYQTVIEKFMEPPVATDCYVSTWILPDSVFAGMKSEDEQNANLVIVENKWASQIMRYLRELEAGEVTLLDLQKQFNERWQG